MCSREATTEAYARRAAGLPDVLSQWIVSVGRRLTFKLVQKDWALHKRATLMLTLVQITGQSSPLWASTA
jgi:hypothetical protein